MTMLLRLVGEIYRFEINSTGADVLPDGVVGDAGKVTKPFCMHSFSLRP